jgi:hypothetical protein
MIELATALALAAGDGLRVEYADLGDWGAAGALLSEYDRASRTIALNTRVVARLRAAEGDAFAERFAVCAILHELHHHRRPHGGEADAHAFARELSGYDPRVIEAALRAQVRA